MKKYKLLIISCLLTDLPFHNLLAYTDEVNANIKCHFQSLHFVMYRILVQKKLQPNLT